MRTGTTCSNCRETHRGVFDLAVVGPEHWPGDRDADREPNAAVRDKTHVLTDDFCIIEGRDHFVRCVLYLPIIGASGEQFGYGVWSTLSPRNFGIYRDTFDSGDQDAIGPWFGWFSNRLKGYPETLNLKCQVCPRSDRERPIIELEPSDHPLAVEQRDGITLDRLFGIYAINGHDLGFGAPTNTAR